MLIYHSSPSIVAKPDVLHSRDNLDFGRGFYATTLREQAEKYAKRFLLRGNKAYLNVYEMTLASECRIQTFDAYDEEWLNFVAACRSGEQEFKKFDIIVGGVANDRIFNTVDLYLSGQMQKEEALKRLIYEKPNNQYCFTNQAAIDKCVRYIRSDELTSNGSK